MATRDIISELCVEYRLQSGRSIEFTSIGGVHAAQRVAARDPYDVALLGSDSIDKLMDAGHIVPGSKRDFARSGIAVAVRSGATQPEIDTEEAVRRTVLASRRVGYSSGPSGRGIAALFERWGIAGEMKDRVVEAPPGVPVGALVARGDAELGFQQSSELMHLKGITVVGPLPPGIQITTVFSGGICARSTKPEEAIHALAFMVSEAADAATRRHGMEPAR